MLSNFFIRSAAAFGGTPFRLNKCTALSSTAGGAAGGAAIGGVPAEYNTTNVGNGVTNTGSGGGGGNGPQISGAGGSGIVIIRYAK